MLQVCLYKDELELPELPEMVFPNNKLIIKLSSKHGDKVLIEFNTLDALKGVDPKNLPDVRVCVLLLYIHLPMPPEDESTNLIILGRTK